MRQSVCVNFDTEKPDLVTVSNSTGDIDAWMDLAKLIEGVGVLTQACVNNGKTHHNGKTIEEYLTTYISRACDD